MTPGLFAVLFGVNAMGLVGASHLNRLLLRRLSMLSGIRGAVTVAALTKSAVLQTMSEPNGVLCLVDQAGDMAAQPVFKRRLRRGSIGFMQLLQIVDAMA
jgi:hypothetical protein